MLGVVTFLIAILLQIYKRISQKKNFENRLKFDSFDRYHREYGVSLFMEQCSYKLLYSVYFYWLPAVLLMLPKIRVKQDPNADNSRVAECQSY